MAILYDLHENASLTGGEAVGTEIVWRSSNALESVFNGAKRASIQARTPHLMHWLLRIAQPSAGWRPINTLHCPSGRSSSWEAGTLMSYLADPDAIFRRTAVYVEEVRQGSKPSDLPVEGPGKFQLRINLNVSSTLWNRTISLHRSELSARSSRSGF